MDKPFDCYSFHLMRYLLENGQVPTAMKTHNTTGKTFWRYIMTDELSKLLKEWTERKKNLKG